MPKVPKTPDNKAYRKDPYPASAESSRTSDSVRPPFHVFLSLKSQSLRLSSKKSLFCSPGLSFDGERVKFGGLVSLHQRIRNVIVRLATEIQRQLTVSHQISEVIAFWL